MPPFSDAVVSAAVSRRGTNVASKQGPRSRGETCVIGSGGAMPLGTDDCATGLYCASGVCAPICDPSDSHSCGDNFVCASEINVFANAGEAPAVGMCQATCDPLRNIVDGTVSETCGGTVDNTIRNVPGFPDGYPSRGCYGLWASLGRSAWSCNASGPPTAVQDDTLDTRIFVNSCAPGYFPGLSAGTGTMRAICSALCNPADTFLGNSSEQGGHHIDGAASTCADRGAAGKDCVYGWFFEVADNGAHVLTRYSNLGVCMDWTRYQRLDGTQLKSCAELAANPDANLDQAFQQGCRPLSAHPGAHRLMPQLHLRRLP